MDVVRGIGGIVYVAAVGEGCLDPGRDGDIGLGEGGRDDEPTRIGELIDRGENTFLRGECWRGGDEVDMARVVGSCAVGEGGSGGAIR